MSAANLKSQRAVQSAIAAQLIFEARTKEHQAACWLGLPKNIDEAAQNVHSALDGVLDATLNQIRAGKEAHGSPA